MSEINGIKNMLTDLRETLECVIGNQSTLVKKMDLLSVKMDVLEQIFYSDEACEKPKRKKNEKKNTDEKSGNDDNTDEKDEKSDEKDEKTTPAKKTIKRIIKNKKKPAKKKRDPNKMEFFKKKYDENEDYFNLYITDDIKASIEKNNKTAWDKITDKKKLHVVKRSAYYNYMKDNHDSELQCMKKAYNESVKKPDLILVKKEQFQ